MTRRLVLLALALCAFVALEGCSVSRLTAPDVAAADKPTVLGKHDPVSGGGGVRGFGGGRREGDGDGGAGSWMPATSGDADSLRYAPVDGQ